jgi:hypothetical protein
MIEVSAFSKPSSIARAGPRAVFSSSRMRSKISTFESTAMPMVSTMPAMPGMVSVAPISVINAISSTRLTTSATTAMQPNPP